MDSIILLREGPGGILEASYSTPQASRQLAAATVHRFEGTPVLFPLDGSIAFGSQIVVRSSQCNALMSQKACRNHGSGTGPAILVRDPILDAPVDHITQSHIAFAETLGKAYRKASDGTRILHDVAHAAAGLRAFSSAPASTSSRHLLGQSS